MATIERRVRSGKTTYRVRYRDPEGSQRTKVFSRKVDAERWSSLNEASKYQGQWLDPVAGKQKLVVYATGWLARQTSDLSTRQQMELRFRLHIFPALGSRPLISLSPDVVQEWVSGLEERLAPNYARVVFANLSAVLGAAAESRLIPSNPCRAKSVKPPAPDRPKVVPWSVERVAAVESALPERYRAMVALGAGCGLRQGEIFGVAVDDVDFLRGVLHVRRQVKIVQETVTLDPPEDGKDQVTRSVLVFAPPKGGSEKERDVPLAEPVALRLAAQLQAWPAVEVTLPWRKPGGRPVTARLVFTTREQTPLDRTYFNRHVRKAALRTAGVATSRDNGMHALRHYFASATLAEGVSINELAEWLGHADPGFTLRVYTHLMPSSAERARRAVALAFEAIDAACGPNVAPGASGTLN